MQVATYVILIVLQGLILISLWTILYQAVKEQGRLLLHLDALDHRLTEAGLGLGGFRVDLDMAFVVWAKCGFCFVRMGSRRQGARAWKPMRLDRSVS